MGLITNLVDVVQVERLESQNIQDYIDKVNIELNKENITIIVELMPISPWGEFVTALNMAVGKAVKECYDIICFQVNIKLSLLNVTIIQLTNYFPLNVK